MIKYIIFTAGCLWLTLLSIDNVFELGIKKQINKWYSCVVVKIKLLKIKKGKPASLNYTKKETIASHYSKNISSVRLESKNDKVITVSDYNHKPYTNSTSSARHDYGIGGYPIE